VHRAGCHLPPGNVPGKKPASPRSAAYPFLPPNQLLGFLQILRLNDEKRIRSPSPIELTSAAAFFTNSSFGDV
jgi:hypothetical protein